MFNLIEINLIPWRDQKKAEDKREFIGILCGSFALSIAIMVSVYFHMQDVIDYQVSRNATLTKEIEFLDIRIGELKNIEQQKVLLLKKLDTLYNLRVSRPRSVSLFLELSSSIPNTVNLIEITQNELMLKLTGKAESNSRVSNYMKKLEESKLFSSIDLEIVKAGQQEASSFNDFILMATMSPNMNIDEKSKKQPTKKVVK